MITRMHFALKDEKNTLTTLRNKYSMVSADGRGSVICQNETKKLYVS